MSSLFFEIFEYFLRISCKIILTNSLQRNKMRLLSENYTSGGGLAADEDICPGACRRTRLNFLSFGYFPRKCELNKLRQFTEKLDIFSRCAWHNRCSTREYKVTIFAGRFYLVAGLLDHLIL